MIFILIKKKLKIQKLFKFHSNNRTELFIKHLHYKNTIKPCLKLFFTQKIMSILYVFKSAKKN